MSRDLLPALVACLIATSGCATLVHRRVQEVTISSSPTDASVVMGGKVVGRTPWTGEVERGSLLAFSLTKDGYAQKTVEVRGRLSWWLVGNVIFLGFAPVGVGVDLISGGGYTYRDGSLLVPLEALDPQTVAVQDRRFKIKGMILSNWMALSGELGSEPKEQVDALRLLMNRHDLTLKAFADLAKAELQLHGEPDGFAERMLLIAK